MLFALKGIDPATGKAIDEQIEAPDQAAAAEIARQHGIAVMQLQPLLNFAPAPVPLDYATAGAFEPFPLKNRRKVVRILLGVEALLLMGFVTWVFATDSSADAKYASLMVALAFLIFQMGILVPVLRPGPAGGPGKSPWYWLSAIALGLVFGVVVMAVIFLAADFYWATHMAFANSDRDAAVVLALYIALASWLVSIPLIVAFMKRGRPESFLARFSAMLFLGSVVEVIAGIPILDLAKRHDSCTCGLASFWAIFLATVTGTIVLGPMIFLIILSRRTRAGSRGLCAACGYDLRKLPNRDQCPQCGAGWKKT